jgi:mRNA interferase MazF
MEIVQYSIAIVSLDSTIGSEIKKTIPCLVISPNEVNQFLNTVVIAPMTTTMRNYPTRVEVTHNRKKGMIAIDQIRTIDKRRIQKIAGKLSESSIKKVKSVIKEMYVD